MVSGNQAFVLYGLISGLTAEIAFQGLFNTLYSVKLQQIQQRITRPLCNGISISPISAFMIAFNAWCVIYISINMAVLFATASTCYFGQFIANGSSQVFYIMFDGFMLYKTYMLCTQKRTVRFWITIILVHRAAWTISDLILSKGFWDADTETCVYMQNPVTGFGNNASDIVADLFCTIVSLKKNWGMLMTGSISEAARVIVNENILRSVVVLFVNSFVSYVFLCLGPSDPFLAWTAYLIQNYFYARCFNAELFWLHVRKQISTRQKESSNLESVLQDSINRLKAHDTETQLERDRARVGSLDAATVLYRDKTAVEIANRRITTLKRSKQLNQTFSVSLNDISSIPSKSLYQSSSLDLN
ncbi:hypothetical protein BDR26DRAFT_865724 [Obelidium mucronatum]|nr:hypothetical protein BDR26DRAFT_865724 [Obelidium mucronatum]